LRNTRLAALYGLTFAPAAYVAVMATGEAIVLSNRLSRGPTSNLQVWLLNLLPSIVVGFVVYFLLVIYLRGRASDGFPVRAHLWRAIGLYVMAIILGGFLTAQRGNSDFWLFGQLVLCPFLVAIAGILADLVASITQRARRAEAV
jgi:xanthine/uracil permease